jgi:hypothetical protein
VLHIYPTCGIFYLPSIDTDTRDRQFNVSSERHAAGMKLIKCARVWVRTQGPQRSHPVSLKTNVLTTGPPSYLSDMFVTNISVSPLQLPNPSIAWLASQCKIYIKDVSIILPQTQLWHHYTRIKVKKIKIKINK